MAVPVTNKYEEKLIKNEGAIMCTTFFQFISLLKLLVAMETSFFLSNLPQISLFPTRMMLHIKFHQDWLTGLRDIQVNIFSIISLWKKKIVAQGHVTLKQIVWSGPKSNSSEILCMSSLPSSLKKTQSKMKVLTCPHFFSHSRPPDLRDI